MRIWITEIGEPLLIEKDARLHRNGNLSRALAKMGHDVTLWTSNFSHAKKIFLTPGDSDQTVEGVKLRILAGPGYKRNISFQRFAHHAHFAKRFYAAAQKEMPPDIILSPVPTLEVAELAVKYGKEHNVPVVTDIRDEWPEEFVDLAPKPARFIARILLSSYFKKIRYICANVSGILGISKRQLAYGMKFSNRPAGEFDRVLPLGYTLEPVDETKVQAALDFWKAQGVKEDAFVGCFFGTIGKFFNLQTVIEAARKTEGVQFVLAGDGSSLEGYRAMAKDVPNVIFPGWVDRPKIEALMRLSDFGLAAYASNTRMSLPNKPFEYLSGGLPVVSSAKGDIEEIIDAEKCGLNYDADSASDLAEKVLYLKNHPAEAEAMGQRGLQILHSRFTIDSIAEQLEKYMHAVTYAYSQKQRLSPCGEPGSHPLVHG